MNAQKEKTLAALLTSRTKQEAAKRAGVGIRTVYRYLNEDAEFLRRYREELGKLLPEATEAARKCLVPALDRLMGIVEDKDIPPGVQVQACRSLLEFGMRLTETYSLMQRLEALEQAERGRGGHAQSGY